jgi:hypothetical protein
MRANRATSRPSVSSLTMARSSLDTPKRSHTPGRSTAPGSAKAGRSSPAPANEDGPHTGGPSRTSAAGTPLWGSPGSRIKSRLPRKSLREVVPMPYLGWRGMALARTFVATWPGSECRFDAAAAGEHPVVLVMACSGEHYARRGHGRPRGTSWRPRKETVHATQTSVGCAQLRRHACLARARAGVAEAMHISREPRAASLTPGRAPESSSQRRGRRARPSERPNGSSGWRRRRSRRLTQLETLERQSPASHVDARGSRANRV